MVNLLPRREAPRPFLPLDSEQHARFELRLRSLMCAVSAVEFFQRFDWQLDEFEAALEELETEASLATALDLLDEIDRARVDVLSGMGSRDPGTESDSFARTPKSELICYLPGRSRSTGAAEVASRGFFDVLDRPPIGSWIEAIARAKDSSREEFEIAIIAWIPEADLERARSGCRACQNGSLSMLGETSKALAGQLRPILSGSSEE